ncbi:SLC13 family permease [Streptomyces sp. LZ34]
MSIHVIGVVALALVFIIGTLRPVNIGALALIAVFLIGKLVAHDDAAKILSGFPPDLFVLLVGVTYLFGLAAVNGTLEWLIERAVGLLGDRPALVPWLIFCFSAVPTMAGALGPAGVAMLAPLCLGLGERYGLDRRMSALMVMHGSCLGNFSPLNGLAIIVQQAAKANGISVSAADLFFGSAAYNLGLAVVVYLFFGGRTLWRQRRAQSAVAAVSSRSGAGIPAAVRDSATAGSGSVSVTGSGSTSGSAGAGSGVPDAPNAASATLRLDQAITLVVLIAVAVGALVFDLEIGFLALIAAALLHTVFPTRFAKADTRIVWSVVLLICGVVTLVAALQRYGTVQVVGRGIADVGGPLLAALLLCLVAAVTSAFASSAGLLGVLIPLAVPFLAQGDVGSTAVIVSLAISATVVDSTPFSSVGALTLSYAPEKERPRLFRAMLTWGLGMAVTAPMLTWLFFILPSAG